jgi:hypothetical protein
VDEGQYYASYAEWARTAGIVSGSENRLRPGEPATRQDLAVILSNYAKHAGKDLKASRSYESFEDEDDIADYAKEAVKAFYESGIVNGRPGKLFDPKGVATRAEAAVMLQKLLG